MKKVISCCFFFSLFLLLLNSCGAPLNATQNESTDKTLKSKGISIILPEDFSVSDVDFKENPDIETMFSDANNNISIVVIKELKADIDKNDKSSAYDYLKKQTTISKGDFTSIIKEEENVYYYEYTALPDFGSDSGSWEYFNTAYESDDSFWFVQFICKKNFYDTEKANFIKWAKTITFY